MNERIKELAEQAGYHPDVFEMCRPGLEKFDELIIKECAVELMKLGNSYSECVTDADYMLGLLDGADIIKEHFRVE